MEVVMTAQLSPESLHNLRHNHLWSKVFYIAIVKNICVKYYFQIITAILSSRMDFTFKKCKKWQVQAPVAAGWAAAGWAVSVVRCDKATVTMSPHQGRALQIIYKSRIFRIHFLWDCSP